MGIFATRRDKLRKLMVRQGCDALLVSKVTNVTYLTGFTGDDSYLLVTPREAVIISDPRYTTQLEEECSDCTLHIRPHGSSMSGAVCAVARAAKVFQLAVEGAWLSVSEFEEFREQFGHGTIGVTTRLVEQLRETKDSDEIGLLRQAIDCAERAFLILRASLRPERTEKEVCDELENNMRRFGAKGASFPPIIAVGARAALPHAQPGEAQIGSADFTLVDWGATYAGYRSDLTRVLVTGRLAPKFERVYHLVLQAQMAAIAAIRPGVTGRDVDKVARDTIAAGGFGKQFSHGLGHGIGLDIHEGPRLRYENDQPLRAGMVVTVEPGIYLPGWGGVRIEDDVLVTKNGHDVLTSAAKQLAEVQVPC